MSVKNINSTDSLLHPEELYGKNTTVRVSEDLSSKETAGEGCTVAEYKIMDGISLVFQDIHEEKLDYGGEMPNFPEDMIAIQHCREGRFEGEYPNGEYIYMGPGNLSVNLPQRSPASNSFPLGHYRGFYIAVFPEIAEASVSALEKLLGPLQIDFDFITQHLSEKNRLAVYSPDEKTSQLISDIYPTDGEVKEGKLKLDVLKLLEILSEKENTAPRQEEYFTFEQVKKVKEIRNYLILHLDEHIALSKLAEDFKISLTGMKKCFKGVYGQSIGKYLREYRMQAGAEKLIFTKLKIIEIASLLGYENAGKFSEAFASYYKMLPSEYRKTFCPHGALPDNKE